MQNARFSRSRTAYHQKLEEEIYNAKDILSWLEYHAIPKHFHNDHKCESKLMISSNKR